MIEKRAKYGRYFIIPFFVVFTVFTAIPLLFSFGISFTDFDRFSGSWVGLANYKRVFTDKVFWQSFVNTWIIWGMSFSVQITLTMLISTILMDVRLKIKRKDFFKTIYFLPTLMATASISILFIMILGASDKSMLNSILLNLGLIDEPLSILTHPWSLRISISLITAWMWFGNSTILVIAGMTSVSNDLYESAWLDGASRWQVYKDITIPSIRPVLTYVLVTSLIGGMQTFDFPYLLPEVVGGPGNSAMTMGVYLYENAFTWMNVGYAAALSIVMFGLISIFANLIRYGMRER